MEPNEIQIKLLNGLKTSFIDAAFTESEPQLRAQFLTNDRRAQTKVLTAIEDELRDCTHFAMSVAFITLSGIEPLKTLFKELEQKGVQGRILTTDYLSFSDPKALKQLDALANIEVRLFRCGHYGDGVAGAPEGFHTKGYIFHRPDSVRLIVGSSNLTQTAMTTNREWNARLVSRTGGEFAQQMLAEFESLWQAEQTVPLNDAIDDYQRMYEKNLALARQEREVLEDRTTPAVPRPNAMQEAFLTELSRLYDDGARRALLISATGTGKTYAAAFAVRQLAPRRMLFIVHREQIAQQALRSFRRVLGADRSYGIYSGAERETEAQYTFATVQTLSKEAHYRRFSPEAFDFIIIDEVHRAGAESYDRIMSYFTPRWWFGMTASPDRSDGYDIYKLFDNKIAYEIQLQDALEENLLCPFHYFGISDLAVDKTRYKNESDFRYLACEERVRHILDRADYYSYSGDRVKGLIFCSQNQECEALSAALNAQGLRTVALSGSNSQAERQEAIARLTQKDEAHRLDYILTVDIFNEGVDIPDVNQVILLRPTESAIIFVQQLGRGLRKAPNKEFVVVLDFIGAFKSNFLIPVALSGDNSYDKDNLRRYVKVGSKLIAGASTIHFDEVSRNRIFASIDQAKTNSVKLIDESYQILKNKLGRIPRLTDFGPHNAIDPVKIFSCTRFGSYPAYLAEREPACKEKLNGDAMAELQFLSRKIGRAQRISEAIVIELILSGVSEHLEQELAERLAEEHGITATQEHIANVMLMLSNRFVKTQKEQEDNAAATFVTNAAQPDQEDNWRPSAVFVRALADNGALLREALTDLIEFMKVRYRSRYCNRYKDTDLVLNEKYTYEDVCRLLNWTRNMNGQNIGGYFYDSPSKTLPVFINYEKEATAIGYADRFCGQRRIRALSKRNRSPDAVDARHIYKRMQEDSDNRIYLFVRRNKEDNEAKSFYFLGEIQAQGAPIPVSMPDEDRREVPAFEIDYRLEQPVRSDIYAYLTRE